MKKLIDYLPRVFKQNYQEKPHEYVKEDYVGNNEVICQLDDGTILSGSDDKRIKFWKNYECENTFKAHNHSVRAICQLDDNHFISGSFDKTIKIWDYENLKCVQTLTEHINNVICLIKIQDNKFASCSCDKTIKIWELC